MNTTRLLRRSANFAFTLGALFLAQPAQAVLGPAPGSLTVETLKLPAAPGSLEGLAQAAELSAFSGQAQHQIPIQVPKGPGGTRPQLTLRYDGNFGDGPMGPGWTLAVPQIRRSLRHGLPSYTDDDELEAVGLGAASGRLIRLENGEYRVLGQGDRVRIMFQNNQFRVLLPGGGMWLLGYQEQTRQTTQAGTFAWLANTHQQPNAQAVNYSYELVDGRAYLQTITWGAGRSAQLSYADRAHSLVIRRAGFVQRWTQLLSRLEITVNGERFGLVQLSYIDDDQVPRLSQVQRSGQTDDLELPLQRFSYRRASGQPSSLAFEGSLPFSLTNPNVTLTDVDGDGLPDLVRLSGADRQWARNTGTGFAPPATFAGPAQALSEGNLRAMDINGDSLADLVVQQGSWIPWIGRGGSYQAAEPIAGSDGMSLGGNQRFADLNGDGVAELLRSSGTALSIFDGQVGGLGAERLVELPPELSGYELRDARLRIQDMTGDGLADYVVLEPTHFTLFEGLGDGRFTVGVRQPLPQQIVDYGPCEFRDLDRNGTVDLAIFIDATLRWFPRRIDGSFGEARTIAAPTQADNTSRLTYADLNGNGSLDAVWSQGDQLWAVELVGVIGQGLLEIIDTGLGQSVTIDYSSTAQAALEAAQQGNPWSHHLASVLPVATLRTISFADDMTPARSMRLVAADPLWDPLERSFAGFARVTQHQLGANDAQTQVTENWYHAGLDAQRVLRGKVLLTERRNAEGSVFERTTTTWQIQVPEGLVDTPFAGIAVATTRNRSISEGTDEPVTLSTRWSHNDQGDVTQTRRLGRTNQVGDEQVVRHSYIYVTGEYHVWGLPSERSIYELDERLVRRSRYTYDGEMEPLPPGQATRGWLRRVEGWLESEQRWVLLSAQDYDPFRNPIRSYQQGVWRSIEYDETGTFPLAEHVEPEAGARLTYRAQWHPVLGTMVRQTDPAGVEHALTYDGLGRPLTRSILGQSPYHTTRYDLEAPTPKITTVRNEGAAGLHSEQHWFNGAGEPLGTVTELDADRWIVSRQIERDVRGFERRKCEPSYAAQDTLTATISESSPCVETSFDALGRALEVVDPSGAWSRITHLPLATQTQTQGLEPVLRRRDGLDRAVLTERSVSGRTESARASYDAAGRLLSLDLQAGGAVHRFGYDTLGRVLFAQDPDQGRRSNTHDDAGRVISSVNAAGDQIVFTYDGAGRVTSETGDQGSARTYHYDRPKSGDDTARTAGRLAWAQEPTGTVEFRYDVFGRIAQTQRSVAGQTATHNQTFSPGGKLLTSVFAQGPSVTHSYDLAGRLIAAAPYWEGLELDASGRPLKERLGNGVTVETVRDARGLTSQQTIRNDGGVLSDLSITRNPLGSPTQVIDQYSGGLNQSMEFAYDGAHRLVFATISGTTLNYSYDGLNNLVARELSGASVSGLAVGRFEFAPEHPRRATQAGSISIGYDDAGRATTVGEQRLTWDAFDRLTALTADGGTQTHRYGIGGLRTLTERIDERRELWFSPNHLRLDDFDHFYIEVLGRRLVKVSQLARSAGGFGPLPVPPPWVPAALVMLGVLALTRSPRRKRLLQGATAAGMMLTANACSCDQQEPGIFYLHRTIGSGPSLITQRSGELVEERRFTPFGYKLDGDTVTHRIGWGDKPTNPATGWADHGARWLAHDLGRWLAPDPPLDQPTAEHFMATPWDATNPYTAMANNPMYFEDPDGENPVAGAATFAGSIWGDVARMGLYAAQGKTHELMQMSSWRHVSERVAVAGARGLAAATGGATSIAATASAEGLASIANQGVNLGRVDGRKVAVDMVLGAASAGLGSMVTSAAPSVHIALTNSALGFTGGLREEAANDYAQLQGWSRPRQVPANQSALKAATAPASFICSDRPLMSGAPANGP